MILSLICHLSKIGHTQMNELKYLAKASLIIIVTLFPAGQTQLHLFEAQRTYAQAPIVKPVSSLGSQPQKLKFRYQPSSGQCIDDQGHQGYNPIDLSYLFDGMTEAQLKDPKLRSKPAYKNKVAECVDFSSFNFNSVIKFDYVRLVNWNLKGAKLDKAEFTFAKMINADLRGAQLQKISIGYTTIEGTIDDFTSYPDNCSVQRARDQSLSKRIYCSI